MKSIDAFKRPGHQAFVWCTKILNTFNRCARRWPISHDKVLKLAQALRCCIHPSECIVLANMTQPKQKALEKICSVFGGYLMSINFPPRKWEGYYAYYSIVGGFLHL